jgi:hypothetical protein
MLFQPREVSLVVYWVAGEEVKAFMGIIGSERFWGGKEGISCFERV